MAISRWLRDPTYRLSLCTKRQRIVLHFVVILAHELLVSTIWVVRGVLAMQVFNPWLLIADDDRSFRETVRSLLEDEGYKTVTASDGEEAVRIVETRDVHILLLDVHMPKLTGLDALRVVRKIRGLLPCILMSGALDPQVIEEARREAVFEILAKPFSSRQLSTAVRQALEKSYHLLAGKPDPLDFHRPCGNS